ncbi:MAG: FxLYD domain-containing protein [Candidatus Bathyarchaeia archaeon]
MNKTITALLLALTLTAFCVASVPNAKAAPEDIKVLSYSWYVSPSTGYNPGDLIVVGEVQNTGTNVVDYVTIQGVAYTADGQGQAAAYSVAYVDHMLPQQKAPFYMDFMLETSFTGNLSWVTETDHVRLTVVRANETQDQQYTDLKIVSDTAYTDMNGVYSVMGLMQNTGTQPTGRVWVVATFYDTSGKVVGAGYSNYLTPASLGPNETSQFTITMLDATTQRTAQISSYALLFQTEQLIPEFPSTAILALALIAVTAIVAVYSRRMRRKNPTN